MNKIQFLRSETAGLVPQATELLEGGLAINLTDGALYSKDAAGNVVNLGVSMSQLAAVAFSGNYNDLLNRPNLSGSLQYKGPWNASTNVPVIPAAAAGNNTWYYVVSVAGTTTIDGQNVWNVGDQLISDGTKWTRIPLSQPLDLTANIPFMVTGTPAFVDAVRYIFTRACSFGNAFLGSKAFATMVNNVDSSVTMQKITSAGVASAVGTITYTAATGLCAFTSNATTTTFAAGDSLLFTPVDTNISALSVNVQGAYATA